MHQTFDNRGFWKFKWASKSDRKTLPNFTRFWENLPDMAPSGRIVWHLEFLVGFLVILIFVIITF